jgi:hypothetical protein
MKLEECIRAVNGMFSQASTVSIRGKFSRLREITELLTADIYSKAASNSLLDSLSNLTEAEGQIFLSLRVDIKS